MISGVAQADVGILVISARKGEFESGYERNGQTREHALLAKTLGVKKIIVAINKMDDSTVIWSKDRFDAIKLDLGKFLRTIGYTENDVGWIPISGLAGSNLKENVSTEICNWWNGKPLLTMLDELQPFERLDEMPLRIPVLDKYRESGKLYIMGKVETGVIKQGDEIFINPNGMKFLVQQIQNDEFIISLAKPGENVKIIIKCLPGEEDYIGRGSVISHPQTPCPVSSELVGQIVILQLLETKPIFTAGYQCIFHVGTAVEEVKVIKLLDQLDKTQKSIKKILLL